MQFWQFTALCRRILKIASLWFSWLLLSQFSLQAQVGECTLDIGGQEPQMLIRVFQLNEEQQAKLETWRAELNQERELIDTEIRQLLEKHPQSTQDDLLNLAKKYSVLQDRMQDLTVLYDQKLLGIFNEKQYEFYTELCEEALRRPLLPSSEEKQDEEPD